MKRYGFLFSLLLPILPLTALLAGRWFDEAALFAWLPIAFSFVFLPVIDAAIGTDNNNPTESEVNALNRDSFFRYLTLAVVPLQLLNLVICGYAFVVGEGGLIGQLGYLLGCGVVSGSTAITTAHELIHKPGRLEQWSGGFLLASVCYATFKPEHLYGHHRHVATPADGSTALPGETVYHFVWRALRDNPRRGFRLEAERLSRRGIAPWSWANEMLWWTSLSGVFIVLAAVTGGALAVALFLGQAFVAVCLLEIINYVEHYGLMRERDSNGRYERISPRHSWNANHLVTNLFLFQLQRHSDHHANGSRRYQALRHFEESPQLPFGYPTAVLVTLLPPLWFRVMNPRVERHAVQAVPATT
ncbi:MAG: alkane 1-monooxygenase [Pseudomonadota bacterium]